VVQRNKYLGGWNNDVLTVIPALARADENTEAVTENAVSAGDTSFAEGN